jgi:transmembrane sensor
MDDKLSKWLKGELNDDELKKSAGAEDVAKYKQIIDEVDKWVPDNSRQLFDPKEISNKPKKTKVRSLYSWMPYSIAASIALAIAAYFFLFNSSIVTHSTGIAEIKEILLPDNQSKIFLAPNSEVSWNKEDWSNSQVAERVKLKKRSLPTRKVNLKGKALFKVEKGSPFSVLSKVGSVEVLGTTFEVDEFGEGMNVICFEGKVRAQAKNGNEVIVNGGDGYLFFNGEWEERILIDESLPSWLVNETKFENAPLTQVIKSLEKLYEIKVEAGSANLKRRFTGTIPNDKIEVALRIVFEPFNIEYTRKGDILYLTE